jgi:predicted nucleotidyltransferase
MESPGELPSNVVDAIVERLSEAPVRLAILFGSYATGRATGGSDVDIGVAYDSDVEDVTDDHLSLVADLTRIIGREDVDVVRLTAVDPRIAVEAVETGVLLIGSPGEAKQLRAELESRRREREDAVRDRISEAERAIERRLRQREHG